MSSVHESIHNITAVREIKYIELYIIIIIIRFRFTPEFL